jgi:hypothetical protein
MNVDGGGAYDVVRVQVASLEEYAATLQDHIVGLGEANKDFKASPTFGGAGFVEASGVDTRHTEVFVQMQQLLQNVRDVIVLTKQALATNAANYSGADGSASERANEVASQLDAEVR